MTTSRDLVAKHANGALNATQIAELTGLTAKNVRKIAKRYNLLIACAELGRQPLIAESVVRDLAAKGMTTREMAEALAHPVLTVRNTARKYKIKVRRPPPPNNLPKRPAKPVPPPAPRPRSSHHHSRGPRPARPPRRRGPRPDPRDADGPLAARGAP